MGLTLAEVEQFKEQGYLVKEGIYSNIDLQLLCQGLTKAIQDKCDQLIAEKQLDRDFAEASFETRLAKLYRHNPDAGHQVLMSIWSGRFHGVGMLETLRHPPLVDCVADLIGPDIVATSIYRVRPKVPGYLGGEVPWHQDAGYSMSHCYDYVMITCWIPLVDATLENGCLWVIPKSHQSGIIRHYTGGHAGFLEVAPEDLPTGAIPMEVSAGSVLLMASMTPHASFENTTNIVRWSIDLRYQDFEVPSNIDEIPQDYTSDRDPVTMACYPGEAYFVIRDTQHPERETTDPADFAALRQRWDRAQVSGGGRRWTPLSERKIKSS